MILYYQNIRTGLGLTAVDPDRLCVGSPAYKAGLGLASDHSGFRQVPATRAAGRGPCTCTAGTAWFMQSTCLPPASLGFGSTPSTGAYVASPRQDP